MHVRPPNPRLVRALKHEQAVEMRERKRKEKDARKDKDGGGAGWKEAVGETEGGDWKKGSSGGDWRSGESGGDWRGSGGGRRRSQSPAPRE